jgi:hypothetical protein
LKIGDKLYQIKYSWGKKPDGSYYIFEVYGMCGEYYFGGGEALNCYGGEDNKGCLYIPENTFVQISDFRKKKFERILNEPF